MTSENTALAIDLTQAILEQFWQQDTSLLLKYIDEDFSLTDALNHSIIQGQQQVCNFIPTAISGIIKSTLTDKMFIIAQNCGSACTVIGKYTLSPISDSDDMVYMKQYCVFIWELSGLGELKLKHIGVTKPDSMSESVYGNAFNSALIPGWFGAEPAELFFRQNDHHGHRRLHQIHSKKRHTLRYVRRSQLPDLLLLRKNQRQDKHFIIR